MNTLSHAFTCALHRSYSLSPRIVMYVHRTHMQGIRGWGHECRRWGASSSHVARMSIVLPVDRTHPQQHQQQQQLQRIYTHIDKSSHNDEEWQWRANGSNCQESNRVGESANERMSRPIIYRGSNGFNGTVLVYEIVPARMFKCFSRGACVLHRHTASFIRSIIKTER